MLYLKVYSNKWCPFLSRYVSQLFKHIMKPRTLSGEDKCHVFQPISWDYQHVSWSLQTYNCWLTNIHLTPSPHIALLYLCFCFKFLAAFCLLSASFSSYPCMLVLHFWLFFSLLHIRLKFGFFLSSISSSHKRCNFLFSNLYYLSTESFLIWYLQVLPFCWVWNTNLASSSFSYHLYPLTYFFPEQ